MKYGILLRFLRLLVYVKRAFWWIGARISFVLGKIFFGLATVVAFFRFKIQSLFRKIGTPKTWLVKRNFLQFAIFIILCATVLPESKIWSNKNVAFFGQKTQAYQLMGVLSDVDIEVVNSDSYLGEQDIPSWKAGTLNTQFVGDTPGESLIVNPVMGGVVAGGTALLKPTIMPGSTQIGAKRQDIVNYTIEPGDSLSEIAQAFGVSVATIIWENNLSVKALIRPGDVLRIPPTTGIMHTVKKGDTLKKIALLYDAEPTKIVSFNHLEEDGTDLKIGERIMIPEGQKPESIAASVTPPKKTPVRNVNQVTTRVAVPPSSQASPSASGYVWPSGSHVITQYYGIKHHALDIAGPWQTPTYAAAAGTVEKSQCGWNAGYGCQIIIDHGNGIKTLYGHHSKLLVSPGDRVEAGQTIGLMGNTGNVRGITGIHLHFEVIKNGVRVNPLLYTK